METPKVDEPNEVESEEDHDDDEDGFDEFEEANPTLEVQNVGRVHEEVVVEV